MISKFRAWVTLENESFMIKHLILDVYEYGTNVLMPCGLGDLYTLKPNEYVLMQSTGLKDKNGVEIFEGDILKHCDRLYTIRYNPNFGIYTFRGITTYSVSDSAKHSNYYEIVGNIYENKELLD